MNAFITGARGGLEFWRKRKMVSALLPHLDWRWHGVGMLQAYICQGDPELRVHLWSPSLVMEGIDSSGDIHDHRFDLRSDVLAGKIRHTEYTVQPNEVPDSDHALWSGTHTIWRLQHNARRQLKIKTQDSDDMIEEPQTYSVSQESIVYSEGISYIFPKRFFHRTVVITPIAVTLVTKTNQDDGMAGILCPIGKPPVPAFGRPISDIPSKTREVIALAQETLNGSWPTRWPVKSFIKGLIK